MINSREEQSEGTVKHAQDLGQETKGEQKLGVRLY